MKRATWVHWSALFVWLLLAFVAQSAWSARGFPELGLVLLLTLCARMEDREAYWAALLAAFVRASFTGESWVVAFAGVLGAVLLVLFLRSFLEVSAPLYSALVILGAVFACDLFWWACAAVRAYWAGAPSMPMPSALALGQVALSSALLALIACWLVPRLPGLAPLVSRKW